VYVKRITILAALIAYVAAPSSSTSDEATVAALDEHYQAAVKANSVAGMDSILAPDFMLVTGKGATYTKKALIESASTREVTYEHQEDTRRTVRVYGNTAVVTALLWEKGTQKNGAFDKKLWFSDVYVRTPRGWKYVFGQASMALPK
jgi:ketosteroid isomerase-like protein